MQGGARESKRYHADKDDDNAIFGLTNKFYEANLISLYRRVAFAVLYRTGSSSGFNVRVFFVCFRKFLVP